MKKITITPEKLRQFGETKNCHFYLITSPELVDHFKLVSKEYSSTTIASYTNSREFNQLLTTTIPEYCHILVISQHTYFKSPSPKDLGSTRKLCTMACNSTPTTLDAIEHFIHCGENADPLQLDKISDCFFDHIEQQQKLIFYDDTYKTNATFYHLNENLQWHEQAGMLGWGQQQLFPSGELSTLPVTVYGMDINSSFDLNGDIALRSIPVLHSGKPSFLPKDQQRIFESLSALATSPLIAHVDHGVITKLSTTDNKSNTAKDILEAMFDMDSRYRTIIEIGFGVNHWIELYPGNVAMNEVFAETIGGTIHWGLGLTPYTQYHLDLISPDISVLDDKDNIIFGKNNSFFSSVHDKTHLVIPLGAQG